MSENRRKVIQVYFSKDNELDMELYQKIENYRKIGMSRNGKVKKLLSDAFSFLENAKTKSASTDIISENTNKNKTTENNDIANFINNVKNNI